MMRNLYMWKAYFIAPFFLCVIVVCFPSISVMSPTLTLLLLLQQLPFKEIFKIKKFTYLSYFSFAVKQHNLQKSLSGFVYSFRVSTWLPWWPTAWCWSSNSSRELTCWDNDHKTEEKPVGKKPQSLPPVTHILQKSHTF